MTYENPETFAESDCQRFVELCVDSLGAMQELGIMSRPKLHAWIHLGTDVFSKGSPALWACWVAEGLNKMLKFVGMGSHRHGWHERVLCNANGVLERSAERKRRRRRRA